METSTVMMPNLDGNLLSKSASRVTLPRLPWEPEAGPCADRPETAPARGIISQLSDDRSAPRGADRVAMIKRELARPVVRDDDLPEVW